MLVDSVLLGESLAKAYLALHCKAASEMGCCYHVFGPKAGSLKSTGG